MANMVHGFAQGTRGLVLILLNNEHAPADAEWDALLDTLSKANLATLRTIAIVDGGAPNADQRRRLNAILNGQATKAAVVSSSSLIRGVVTALSWFNSQIKSFSLRELGDAFTYLDIKDKQEVMAVWSTIVQLRSRLGFGVAKDLEMPVIR